MKILIFIFAMLLSSVSMFGSTYKVKGEIIDSITGCGEPYATIRIYPTDKKTAKPLLSVSDESGKFEQTLETIGNYMLSVSAVGRKNVEKIFELSSESTTLDLGRIFLADNSAQLNELVVSAKRPVIQTDIDKLTYNVADDPSAGGNSVMEMLRKVPMVNVDGQDNITVKGNSNFKIYINGRPDPMLSSNAKDVLKSMPASSIKKIEVITEPGAKYDAEGGGGILNIVTTESKSFDGYLLSLDERIDTRSETTSLYGRTKFGKFTLSANYTLAFQFNSSNNQNSHHEDFESGMIVDTKSTQNIKNAMFNMGGLQASFEPDTLNLFTTSVNLFSIGVKADGNSSSDFYTSRQQNLSMKYDVFNKYNVGQFSLNAAFNYQHTFFKPGHNIILSYLYNRALENREQYVDYSNALGFESLVDQFFKINYPSNEHTFQIDYSNPLNDKHLFETGAKYILRRNNGNTQIFNKINNDYELSPGTIEMQQFQDIYSIYASYNLNLKKFGFKAGIRYEHTRLGIDFKTAGNEDFTSYLNDIVPNVAISWNFSQLSNLRLNYQMRISRPDASSMNPFCDNSDRNEVSCGNPSLSSEHNHMTALTYSNYAGPVSMNLSIGYSLTNNMIGTIAWMENGIKYSTFVNSGRRQMAQFDAYLSYKIIPEIKLNIGGAFGYKDFDYKDQNIKIGSWGGNIFSSLDYEMPWRLNLSLYGGWTAKQIDLQSKSSDSYYYGMTLSRSFLKENRMKLTIFATSWDNDYTSITSTPDFQSIDNYNYVGYQVGFSINFRFGGLKQNVKSTNKSIINDDIHRSESSAPSQGINK